MRDETIHARDAARKRAASRNKARTVAMRRKEEYLGARVPKELRSRVVRRAEELGVPVSILIRDILMAAFRTPQASASPPPSESWAERPVESDFSSVLGWEDMRLNKSVQCSRCGVPLSAGSSVTAGVDEVGRRHIILCNACKEAV